MGEEPNKSGLYIDSDWKKEAAQEKQQLAEAEAQAKAKAGVASAAGEKPEGLSPQETAFLELVNMMAMQAAIGLGGFQGPGGEQIPPDVGAAKHYIDMLDVLADRTKGNLSDIEKRSLDGVLYELRMQYAQIVAQAAKAPPAPEQK